jgi:hypothetical protein
MPVMISRRAVKKSLRTNFNPGARFYVERAKLRGYQALHLPLLVAGAKVEKPIFVIGAPRSGTMLLYTILRTHSMLAHWRPSEAHEVWEADYHPALRGWESNVLNASDLIPKVAERIRRTFFLVTGPRKRLIDKTPRNVLRVPLIDAVFPDACYIHLVRDGRENVNSLINAWRSPRYRTYRLPEPHSIPGVDPNWWKFVLYPGWREDVAGPLEVVCAKQWMTSNEHVMAASNKISPERWVEVRYEELIEHPVEEVGRLLEFVGLAYEAKVEQRAAATATTPINVVTPPERGKWRRENPNEINNVLPLIRPTMEAMGYTIDAH